MQNDKKKFEPRERKPREGGERREGGQRGPRRERH